MRPLKSLTISAVLLFAASVAVAGGGHAGKSCHGHRVVCPNCHFDCYFEASKDTETKHCYGVECKEICIPHIVFPWQSHGCGKGCDGKGGKDGCCAAHNGAKSRVVHVLKKYEYECRVCKYKWNPSNGKKAADDDKVEPGDVPPPAPPEVTTHRAQPERENVATPVIFREFHELLNR